MKCARCKSENTELVGDTHYICNDCKAQFYFIIDDKIHFPYNQIFRHRSRNEFFRKPDLEIKNVGNENVNR